MKIAFATIFPCHGHLPLELYQGQDTPAKAHKAHILDALLSVFSFLSVPIYSIDQPT